ncbi:hypothetical protein [Pleionea mediterranea]|uniref:Bacteriophage CI repressor-like protein n=1 Tax=Pleionea mediterranea TaxID=523701 RepID=A0A316FVV5_9GAMM|nr:hypothetical protein [Pleionea mediterranea]PWK52851.1 hypothetical protein C8D97_10469 [Pleionea mediterranea]
MCDRLIKLNDNFLKLSHTRLAQELGYSNDSVVYRIYQRKAFPDPERLVRLANIIANRKSPNIHWLITGNGDPMIRAAEPDNIKKRLDYVLANTPKSKVEAVISLLEN